MGAAHIRPWATVGVWEVFFFGSSNKYLEWRLCQKEKMLHLLCSTFLGPLKDEGYNNNNGEI